QNNRATQRPQPRQKIERNKKITDKESKKIEQEEKEGYAVVDAMIKVVTGLKTVNINYNETNGIVLPGFIPGLGFFGSSKPTLGFVFGAQDDIRYEAAKRGWLTEYPEFNQVYSEMRSKRLDFRATYTPFRNFSIEFSANREESYNLSEQYDVMNGVYQSRSPYEYGYFTISTNMI